MNIASAINAALTAFPQQERRVALAQFLTRYSVRQGLITHYRCVGLDLDVIDAFLKGCGMEHDADYTVVRSSLDPATAQVRWSNESKRLPKLVSALAAAATNPMLLYMAVIDGAPERIFPDASAPSTVSEEPETSEEHIVDHVLRITDSYGDRLLTEGYEELRKRGDSPVLVPLALVEQIAWRDNLVDRSLASPEPMFDYVWDNDRTDFANSCLTTTTRCHCLGLSLPEVYPGILSAPTISFTFGGMGPDPYEVRNSDNTLGNPLRGYMCVTARDARDDAKRVPSATGLFAVTSAPIRVLQDEAATLKMLEFASCRDKLWRYIEHLYTVVYKLKECVILPYSRIGVSPYLRSHSLPFSSWHVIAHGYEDSRGEFGEGDDSPLMVILAMYMTTQDDSSLPGWLPRDRVGNDEPKLPVEPWLQMRMDLQSIPVHRSEDLYREWYSMIHGIWDGKWLEEAAENKTSRRHLDYRSCLADCPTVPHVGIDDILSHSNTRGGRFTQDVVDIFLGDGSEPTPLTQHWTGPKPQLHCKSYFICNVYSGPEEIFMDAVTSRARLTALVDRLAQEPRLQTVSPDTPGAPNGFTVLIETNFSISDLSIDRKTRIRRDLEVAFRRRFHTRDLDAAQTRAIFTADNDGRLYVGINVPRSLAVEMLRAFWEDTNASTKTDMDVLVPEQPLTKLYVENVTRTKWEDAGYAVSTQCHMSDARDDVWGPAYLTPFWQSIPINVAAPSRSFYRQLHS